ncbi:MAG: alkyl hydroperoxide reductase [Planctomycetota bacterium]|nr:MAG: alkyl hydroperoxide reductase [Planctomycetota bacterium]
MTGSTDRTDRLAVLVAWTLMVFAAPIRAAEPGRAVAARDATGSPVSIDPAPGTLTVVCFLGTQCPVARSYVPRLSELAADFRPRGLRVYGVMSNVQDSAEEIRAFIEELRPEFPILVDTDGRLADRFGATRTPEAFLLDGDLNLRYHGRIDDQFAPGMSRTAPVRRDLRIAIEELLAGKPVTIKSTRALGCRIGRPAASETGGPSPAAAAVTFHRDVQPMLETYCIDCHRAGEIGPFGMESYEEVVGWAETMLEVIDQGRMPPWHADPRYNEFANARHMPPSARDLLAAWIDAGKPLGDASQRGPTIESPRESISQPPAADDSPEYVFAMRDRGFHVPASGVVDYQYFVIDPGFTQDQWVRRARVLPGARDVVHHAIVFVRPPDFVAPSGIGWLAAYVPGQRGQELPDGYARRIPAGSKLVFQMHYTPSGVAREDVTRIALSTIDPEQVTHEVFTAMALNQDFEIPPGAAEYEVTGRFEFPPPESQLLAITPHMHFRGKSFTVSAAWRSQPGDETILLHVPHYDFNWQHTYVLKHPLPMGDVAGLEFAATFDNSPDNPWNPDPQQWVTWGDQSWEEMAVVFLDMARPRVPARSQGAQAPKQASDSDSDPPPRPSPSPTAQRLVDRLFSHADRDGDGIIESSEGGVFLRKMSFYLWDSDGDGRITREEASEVADLVAEEMARR